MQLANTSLFNDINLVSYYKLENTSDSKGANILTNNNSATFVTAKYANGANLNNSPYLSQATSFGIGSGSFTFVGWVEALGSIGSTSNWQVFYCTDTGANITIDVIYEGNSGTPRMHFKRRRTSNSTPDIYYTFTMPTASFTHLGITFDGSTLTGYVNGVNIGTASTSGTGTGSPPTAGFLIGNNENGGNLANVIADDVGVFTRALSASEILLLAEDDGGGAFLHSFMM